MLKKCGRKSVSNVWKYFSYDRASDKSRCLIDDMKDSSGNQKCDALLTGNNATNLKKSSEVQTQVNLCRTGHNSPVVDFFLICNKKYKIDIILICI